MKPISIIFAILFLTMTATGQEKTTNSNSGNLPKNPLVVADKNDRNNNFYDNEETFSLPQVGLEIAGEVENPGKVDFSKFQKRSVIVKETLLNEDGSNSFV